MENIKEELQDLIENDMIPEVELYLEDLMKLLENNEAKEDDMVAIKEMEDFLVELQNIIEAINQNKITDEEAAEVHAKIMKLFDESEEALESN